MSSRHPPRIEPGSVAALYVKNGIGYGHLQRATLVAQALLGSTELSPVIVSQARSVELLRGSGLRGINLPRLNRVSSALVEDVYWEILDRLFERLRPQVLAEDTFPDQRLNELPSIAGVPRVLISRRLDPVTFERMISEGAFHSFERIVVCQHPEEFDAEPHSAWARRIVSESGRFEFVGPLWRRATESERRAARMRYAGEGQKLCVVAAGAGGDKYADGFTSRLLTAAHAAVKALDTEVDDWSVVIITGPYAPPMDLGRSPRVHTRRWEPDLPALLAGADIAIIKPGTNSLLEALDGSARVIVVPDRSYGEGLIEYSRSLAREGRVLVAAPEKQSLTEAVTRAVREGSSRGGARAAPSAGSIAATVATAARSPMGPATRRCFWGLRTVSATHIPAEALTRLRIVVEGGSSAPREDPRANSVATFNEPPPSDVDPGELLDRGVQLFAVSSPALYEHYSCWLRARGIPPDLYLAVAPSFRLSAHNTERFVRWVVGRLHHEPFYTACVVDYDGADGDGLTQLMEIATSMSNAGVSMAPLTELRGVLARAALHGHHGR